MGWGVRICLLTALSGRWPLGNAVLAEQNGLIWSTFLGGSSDDRGGAIAVDSAGSVYVTGQTYSVDFPTTAGAYDTTHHGNYDVIAAKITPEGTALEYATLMGGSSIEGSISLAIDGIGCAYIIGRTESGDFPVTPGAYDTSGQGYSDVFIVKLNPQVNALDYATYLGGTGNDYGRGIRPDGAGAVYLTGLTRSTDFPVTADAFDTTHNGALGDVFMARLNPAGRWLSYSTFLGGSGEDGLTDWGGDIALDKSSRVYLTGFTLSADFPTTSGALDTTFNGSWDAFVTKLFLSAPEKVTDLRISPAGENLALEWSAVTADTNGHFLKVDYYRIYRDSSAGSDPDGEPFDSTVETCYVDSSVELGHTGAHYYYLVTAVTGGRGSEPSRCLGGLARRLSRVK